MVKPRVVLIVGAVALATGGVSAIAHAHEVNAPHGNDFARNHATYYAPHVGHYVDACDQEPDGNQVRAEWKVSGSPYYSVGFYDQNGADPGCEHYFNDPSWGYLQWHRCVEIGISTGDARWH